MPLSYGVADGFRRYFFPRAGDVASGGHKLPPISELDGHASLGRMLLLPNEAAAASTIALLLQVRLI